MTEDFSTQTVLVVDDKEQNRFRYLKLIKKRIGCQVASASNRDEAIQKVKHLKPAVVLLDVCMPDAEDGLAVCRAIKQGRLHPEVQVVMVTANADTRDVLEHCSEAGADDFLAKDATNEETIARVRSKLRAQRWRSELLDAERRGAVADLAESVAHDLRGALSPALFLISEIEDMVDGARKGIDFVAHQLGELDRLAKARGEMEEEDVWVRDLLAGTVTWSEQKAKLCRCQLRNACSGDFAGVVNVWKPGLLFSLVEMVGNAATIIKHGRKKPGSGQPPGEIVLDAAQEGQTIRIVVSDNGPGVPAGMVEDIFEKGMTSRKAAGGSGRGLFFVKARVEKAGGNVYYEPNEPRGSRFVIELPAVLE